MARRTIFLETAFWDYFSKCRGLLYSNPDAEDVDDKISLWNNIYKFICRSSVFTDTPLHELAEKAKTDTRLRLMLKSSGDGNMDLDYQEDPFPDLESNSKFEYDSDYSSLFFTAEDHEKAARNHGVINICNNNIWNQEEKFKDTGVPITRDEEWDWGDLKILKETSNAMVLVDNFILTPNKKTGYGVIRSDLKSILAQILPDFSKEKYTLSVIYYDKEMDEGWNNDWDKLGMKRNVETRKNQFAQSIRNFVKEVKRHLDLTIELFPTTANEQFYRKDFHDRTIITNNIWVGSEAGFDIHETAANSTTTHGLYLGFGNDVAKWLERRYDVLVSEAKACLKRYDYQTVNRILL